MSVGVRELKANLSEYLARAERGEEVIVTDRNRPIARLVAYANSSTVERGVEEGWIEAPRRTQLTAIRRRSSSVPTAEALEQDRG
jgi:prevent-host-death family protein